jgi:isoleucyl-tRNA synthetase
VSKWERPWLALDIALTPELIREGFARDIIRHIQDIRKCMGLEFRTRVQVWYATDDPVLTQTVVEHGRIICSETLCGELHNGARLDMKEVTLSGRTIRLCVVATSEK